MVGNLCFKGSSKISIIRKVEVIRDTQAEKEVEVKIFFRRSDVSAIKKETNYLKKRINKVLEKSSTNRDSIRRGINMRVYINISYRIFFVKGYCLYVIFLRFN